jgi:hypothetical protein
MVYIIHIIESFAGGSLDVVRALTLIKQTHRKKSRLATLLFMVVVQIVLRTHMLDLMTMFSLFHGHLCHERSILFKIFAH